jgi:hypothetical protein
MKDYYTLKEAMERLGLKSVNAFRQLERKYLDVFMNVNQHTNKGRFPWYDKATIDKFAKMRAYFKQENHEHTLNP